MVEWIKWWNNKDFLKLLLIVLIVIVTSFLVSYFFNGYWKLVTIPITCLGGFIIRKNIINMLF